MSQTTSTPTPPPRPTIDYEACPVYWFTTLDRAVARGDYATAARAQRALRRLGVDVKYGRPRVADAAK